MSKRLEAAVKAWDHHWGDRYGDEALEEMGEEVQVALDAADAVMFSDRAVERAARKMFAASGNEEDSWVYMPPEDQHRQIFMQAARAAAEAFKADADV